MASINPMNTDIYDIIDTVNDLQKDMMEDQDEETLSIGLLGYMASVQSMQIQNSIITASELGNEIFPYKAKFEKNIVAHAITQNITNINAQPAIMSIMIGINKTDLEDQFQNDIFRFDRESKIFVNSIEFHFQYDIVLSRTLGINNQYTYSARYDMSLKNPLSKITNPYLKTPFIQTYGGVEYLFIYCDIIQVKLNSVQSKIISSTPIENKVFEFSYAEQLAGFNIKVTENEKTTYLTPVFEGIGVDQTLTDFCYYSFIDLNNIRVTFDSISYVPQMNAVVEAEVWTTLGTEGNFSYSKNFSAMISSSNYNYKNVPVRIMIGSDSEGGMDKKSIDELRKLIPKEALSRGSLSNTTSLQNYFNMINTDENKLDIYPKTDNQFERSYYAYLVLKDQYNNVIPTNTVDIRLNKDQFQTKDNRKYTLLPGTCVYLDKETGIGQVIEDEERISELVVDDKETFIYALPLMMIMTDDPLYISYYSTIINYAAYLDFTYINYNAPIQFVAPSITWKRNLIQDRNKYKLNIPFTQNIMADLRLMEFDSVTNELLQNNIRVFIVIYNKDDSIPYRYAEATLGTYHYKQYYFEYNLELETTDQIDDKNRIKINGVKIPGTNNTAYGYMTSDVTMKIYICGRFGNGTEYGRYDLDDIVPDLNDYTVCNMFTVNNGISFYNSYTDIITSTASHVRYQNNGNYENGYMIKSVPLVRYSYIDDEDCIQNFISELDYKKAYIDNALYILENNFKIDFKLYNTYGPSRIYSLDEEGLQKVSRVNLTLNFRLKLIQSTDSYTVGYIIKDIKDILEDLNDISSLHIPNLITEITTNYRNAIEYFEFLGINDYGPGVQHLYKNNINEVGVVPEFLTVHTNEDLTPDINIVLA